MLTYTLLIYQASPRTQAGYTAYRFAKAAISRGHRIGQVFFYGEAVSLSQATTHAPQDERQVATLWQALAQEYQIPLVCCNTALQWRGLIANMAFQAGSLGQFIESTLNSERVLTFGVPA
jgi:tRNA 2-thiouridine synthesizing protein D